MPLTIRPMTQHDLEVAVSWAAAEGWNPGLADAVPYRVADPDGFLMAFDGDTPVSCISAVRYGADYGFIGLYICVPKSRGTGCGIAVWKAAIALLEGRTVGLDGVVEQQANYAKSGFAPLHRNVRYGGTPTITGPQSVPEGVETTPDPDALIAYDAAFFPAPRDRFMRAWLSTPGHVVRAVVEGGVVKGYGVLRPCGAGAKIGPLFADNAEIAEALFAALVAAKPEGPVYLDLPEPNGAAVALATRHGLAPVFEAARMYKGTAPDLPIARTFGITTLELG